VVSRWGRWAIVVLGVLGSVRPTDASSALLSSTPDPGATVPSPSRVVLQFNGRVETRQATVTLIGGPRQTRIQLVRPDAGDRPDLLIYPLPVLEPGPYRLEWKALSIDGQPTDGSLSFEVVAPGAAPRR
jgi:methionine-rich copper-binding protein CopC